MNDEQRKAMFAKQGSKGHGISSGIRAKSDDNKSIIRFKKNIVIKDDFGRTLVEIPSDGKFTKTQKEIVDKLSNHGVLSESDIRNMKQTLEHSFSNSGENVSEFEKVIHEALNYDNMYDLTQEQKEKGIKFLKQSKIYNNVFGARERGVLDNVISIKLQQFHDDTTTEQAKYGIKRFSPVYHVQSKDNSFDYHYSNGKVHLVG